MYESFPGFGMADIAQIIKYHMPEARIEQVQHGVFGAAHVEVHRHPVFFLFQVPGLLLVMRVQVTQIIPAGAGPLRHGIGLAQAAASGFRVFVLQPVFSPGQGRLAVRGGLVVFQFGQQHGQLFFGDQAHRAVLVVHQGEWFTPVALSGEEPVAQLVVDAGLAYALAFQPVADFLLALLHGQPVDADFRVGRIEQAAFAFPAGFAGQHFGELQAGGLAVFLAGAQDAFDRQVEFAGELEVAAVMGRHRHNGAAAVADEHVVGNPDGDQLLVDRVDGVCPDKLAAFLFVQLAAVQLGLGGGGLLVGLHGGFALRAAELFDQGVFRSQHHIGGSEQGVRPGGIDLDALLAALHREKHFGAAGFAYPVFLHFLGALGPVQLVNAGQQAFGVFGDFQHPLAHGLAYHRVVAHLGMAVDDLLVGQHRAQLRTPVHRLFRLIGQAFLIELGEYPLRPLVVFWVGGVDLAVPVVAEAEGFELFAEDLYILGGGFGRVRAGFDGVLFGWQAEGVPAHGMQHIVAAHALIAAPDIRGGIALGVAYVQAVPRRIGEHVQHI